MYFTHAGESFPAFPYPPYDIQEGFMHALYQALDKGGVGLFESPTGMCFCCFWAGDKGTAVRYMQCILI